MGETSGSRELRLLLAYFAEERMARYEHLPIYKKAMALTIYGEQTVRNFTRYHKL